MLAGKKILITGVLTRNSIGFAVAKQAQQYGAEIVLTSFGRARSLTERTARRLDGPPDVLELDVTQESDFDALASELTSRWGGVDGVLHAIAYAPPDALNARFLEAPTDSALSAFEISAVSLKSLGVALIPLFEARGGGSIVGLDFDASHAWPGYDWMGVAKAGLESVNRYLAFHLGRYRVRSNLIASGVIRSEAARAIPGFDLGAKAWAQHAPLGWDASDPYPIADAACFLLSDAARAITGEILHVDGGHHAVANGLGLGAADGASSEPSREEPTASLSLSGDRD